MEQEQTLDKANKNVVLKVTKLLGKPSERLRLMQLGIIPGATVQILRAAPLQDPIEVKVKGTNVALRRNECQAIAVVEGE